MLSFPEPIRIQRRTKVKRPTRAPVAPLTLISATVIYYGGSDSQVSLVFDVDAGDPLIDLSNADYTKWTANYDGVAFVGNSPLELMSVNTVLLYMGSTGEGAGPYVVNYAADPSDIGTKSGRMLAAIVDGPLVGA